MLILMNSFESYLEAYIYLTIPTHVYACTASTANELHCLDERALGYNV